MKIARDHQTVCFDPHMDMAGPYFFESAEISLVGVEQIRQTLDLLSVVDTTQLGVLFETQDEQLGVYGA